MHHLDHPFTTWRPLLALAPLAQLVLLGACTAPSSSASSSPPPARSMGAIVLERVPPFNERRPESERRFKDAGVYLDGKPLGVLKRSELPPTLAPIQILLADGRKADRFRVADYLRALSVPLDRLRAAHFIGGRRAAMISGDEIRKHDATFYFSFTRGDSGKPRMHLPAEGIKLNTTIDIIAGLALYIDKEPPQFDPKALVFHFGDGKPIEGIPYATTEIKGTRIYIDGMFLAALKRKILPDRILIPGSDLRSPRFLFAGWLEEMGVELAQIRAIELIAGDDIVTRLQGSEWELERPHLSFSIPRHSQGRMLVHLPPDDPALKAMQNPPREASIKVSAIMVYEKNTPPPRAIRPLAEILEESGGSEMAQPAAEDGAQ